MQEIVKDRVVFSPTRLEPPLTSDEVKTVLSSVCIEPSDLRSLENIATDMILNGFVRLVNLNIRNGENNEI